MTARPSAAPRRAASLTSPSPIPSGWASDSASRAAAPPAAPARGTHHGAGSAATPAAAAARAAGATTTSGIRRWVRSTATTGTRLTPSIAPATPRHPGAQAEDGRGREHAARELHRGVGGRDARPAGPAAPAERHERDQRDQLAGPQGPTDTTRTGARPRTSGWERGQRHAIAVMTCRRRRPRGRRQSAAQTTVLTAAGGGGGTSRPPWQGPADGRRRRGVAGRPEGVPDHDTLPPGRSQPGRRATP